MKRSNLKAILKEVIQKRTNEDSETCKLLAIEIMDKLEEIGMQPPNITIDKLIPNSGLVTIERHYYACWEPEEELK